jgi:hypothetical protein
MSLGVRVTVTLNVISKYYLNGPQDLNESGCPGEICYNDVTLYVTSIILTIC